MQQRLSNSKGIFLLWLNWVMGFGMITLLIVLSLWVRPIYMPFIAYGLQFVCFLLIRRNREKQLPVCYLFPFLVSRIMFWTGTVMLIINLLYSRWLVTTVFNPETINPDIPFITALIVSPITFLISLWFYTHRQTISFCRDCRMRAGTTAERGFLGMIFTREGRYQMFITMCISFVITVTAWLYYGLTYVNTSLSLPDRFVFFWSEVMLWIASAIYLALRYIGIIGYYCQDLEGSAKRHGQSTQMRYIMIADNYIGIKRPETSADSLVPDKITFDTPVSTYLPWKKQVSLSEASHTFYNLTDLDNVNIRFMYSNISGNADCNIFHYLVFLTPEEQEQFNASHPDCEWMSFRDVVKLLNDHELNPLMSAEIVRLYTISMAWKTYHRNGKRRYRIKHYRPTFRVMDVKKWGVDYNDPAWLYVADNNQDVPFYNLRRLWRKYINGVGNLIEEIDQKKAAER